MKSALAAPPWAASVPPATSRVPALDTSAAWAATPSVVTLILAAWIRLSAPEVNRPLLASPNVVIVLASPLAACARGSTLSQILPPSSAMTP
ncbi:hypothetical protein D3C76_728650 [compost metagenome]